ncbi:NAD-binding protein [Gymnopilus junonius]|uniref:NAD-binding protein n=1 Tax=Gymnopilus junonius TaxID=109634 RepID=A0A9P5NX41_GYMJU|nr:NAD-binding protein [Gymnopilus junonius]
MSPKLNILMTGVTGFIGGSVLKNFLNHPDFSSFNITVLVRSPEKADKLKKLGVNPVLGSHDEEKVMVDVAAENDVVIAMADADNFKAAQAVLKGLKKRYEKTKTVPILIHTSGTGVLADNAEGHSSTETIYDDSNPDQIESLPDSRPHRNVDLEILRADKEGYVRTHIVLPSTIWGFATGVLADQGIQNRFSIQVPQLIRASLNRRRGGMVGEGRNIWPDVDVNDVAELYVVLFNAIRAGNNPAIGHGRDGFYFGENGEHTLYEVGKAISVALVQLGLSEYSEPSTFTKEEINEYLEGSTYLGSNSRCRGRRSRAIGWKPTKTKEDFLASIKPEVEVIAGDIKALA